MADGSSLERLLRSTARWNRGLHAGATALQTAGILLGGSLVAISIDAVVALRPGGLIVLDVVLLGLAMALVVRLVRVLQQHRYNPRRTARWIEERLGIGDNSLINAVEFWLAPRVATSPMLQSLARDVGINRAAHIHQQSTVSLSPLLRSAGVAALALVATCVIYLIVPQLFQRGVPRLMDPWGNHPPFTLLHFQISYAPDTVYQGRAATIRVTIHGPDRPQQADIVFLDPTTPQRIAMFPTTEAGNFQLPIEHVHGPRTFYVDTLRGRSESHQMPVIAVPLIESAEISFEFASYTKWPRQRQSLTTPGLRALEGSQARILVRSNIPLQHAHFEMAPVTESSQQSQPSDAMTQQIAAATEKVVLHPDPSDPTSAEGAFTLSTFGTWQLTLTGTNGSTSDKPLVGTITSVPDREPYVAIVSPEAQAFAVEGSQVPVVIETKDDVGIDRMLLSASVNNTSTPPWDVQLNARGPTFAQGTHTFDLAASGAKAGDRIAYFASVYDNKQPESQGVDSRTHVIQVISLEEYRDFLREATNMEELTEEVNALRNGLNQLQEQRNDVLQELQATLDRLAEGEPMSEAQQAQLQAQLQHLQEQLKQFAQTVTTRRRELPATRSTIFKGVNSADREYRS
ncbi:MAG: hypothetical protein O3C60_09665 [Planctomycetota bacterium]|nr:hypothetical protein [Planctomycetota bacterium]